jgi:hypothetical protein
VALRVSTSPPGGVVLRGGVAIGEPLAVVLRTLERYARAFARYDAVVSSPLSFGEADLRLANGAGARISAAEIEAILDRRPAIERALRAIRPEASLAGAAGAVPWRPLGQLFDAFAGVPGFGCSKMTKALHRKRPALVPILDSIVAAYLAGDDLGAGAPFGARALELVRGYRVDVVRNRVALRRIRRELARRGWELSEVRILDVLILEAAST